MHYTVPITTATADGYIFPGEYVGQYGAYEAIKHLFSQSDEHKGLAKEEHLLINKNHFAVDLERAVSRARADFRERHQIPDKNTVIFFAPGDEVKEAEFTLPNVVKGVKEFILKYSCPTSLSPKAPPVDHFTTVISIHKGSESEKYIRDFLKENEWKGRLIIVDNENNEHYNAMAASDIGLIYDGQMVSSAVACHLPTMILIKMRMHHQWYNDLFNRWWNDMDIIADNNIYPELIGGEVWPGKICDTLAEWYVKADTRYDMIRKWEYYLKDALSY
jgi:lipid A disaccharide synthetase